MKYTITGGTIVSPEYVIKDASITVEGNKIIKIGDPDKKADFQIKLEPGMLIFPGLINPHDHLLGTYFPKIGTGPYLNWLPWDNDLKSHDVYLERNKISNDDLYLLGAYKNLISGVTTVSDHMPHLVNDEIIDKMPVRVLKDYALEHECSSFDLRWGKGISEEFKEAREYDVPFITHIEEGFDEESTLGVDILREMNALDDHTVLIHGISFSKSDIEELARKKVNVVWCPSSNYYMFKETADIKELLKRNVNVSLGTDSPMSGGLNILDEMRFASSLYKDLYHEEIDPKILTFMVTLYPAKALRLKSLGKIEIGYIADFMIINGGNPQDPYRSLLNSWFDNVELVIKEGIPLYGYKKYGNNFKKFKNNYQSLKINGKDKIIIGRPIDLYKRIWDNLKFKKILPFLPIN